jgi:hypothetical protein
MSARPLAPAAALACALGVLVAPLVARAEGADDDSAAAASADDDELEPPPAIPPIVGMGVAFGAMVQPEMKGLNDFTTRAALGSLPGVPFVFEPSLTLQIGRVVLPLRMRLTSVKSAATGLALDGIGGSLGVGYTLLKRPNVLLYPSLSFGLMRSRITAGVAAAASDEPSFGELLVTDGPVQLSRITFTGEAAFDAAYRIVGSSPEARGLYGGVHLGFVAGLAESSWTLDNSGEKSFENKGGPHAPVGGPLATVTIALRL